MLFVSYNIPLNFDILIFVFIFVLNILFVDKIAQWLLLNTCIAIVLVCLFVLKITSQSTFFSQLEM